ncbi:MAG: nitroreductase family protein [Planctomycetes bacterium]|nr:nitroreductase family protein [Planctomycetota bacterium]
MTPSTHTQFRIHDLIAERWSPRSFADRPVPREPLGALFEAARWGASCYNAQPWRYLVATRADAVAYERLASCLVESNASWATRAPVLVVALAQTHFAHNGKPNAWAKYDTGGATGNLSLQAQAMGLAVRQMGGFDPSRVRELCQVPDGFEPLVMLAIGFPGAPEQLPDEQAAHERAPRERMALESMVFGSQWQSPSPLA